MQVPWVRRAFILYSGRIAGGQGRPACWLVGIDDFGALWYRRSIVFSQRLFAVAAPAFTPYWWWYVREGASR
jgi:hypothetical protein